MKPKNTVLQMLDALDAGDDTRFVHGKWIPVTKLASEVDRVGFVRGPEPKTPPQYDWIKVEHKSDGTWRDSIGFESVYNAEEMWPDLEFRDKNPWTRFGGE